MKPKHIFEPMYRQNYMIFYGWSAQAYMDYVLKNYHIKLEVELACDGSTDHLVHEAKGLSMMCVFVCAGVGKKRMPVILAHELIHACFIVLNNRLVKTTHKNNEPLAYLHTYLMEQII